MNITAVSAKEAHEDFFIKKVTLVNKKYIYQQKLIY